MVRFFENLGLDVAITEMDVKTNEHQGATYGKVVDEALRAGIRDISFWGFADSYCFGYTATARPCMFDGHIEPKPAFYATFAAIHRFAKASRGE
jgi:endo-1,4-beta-xylanase